MTPTYFVFDTETTGLPPRAEKGAPPIPADDPRQPRMASFAYVIADQRGAEIEAGKLYIRPDGWTMAEHDARAIAEGKRPASEVNGLTDAFLAERGRPISEALDIYERAIAGGLIVVAFNAVFDTKIMRGEMRRAGRPDLFEETRNICVMRALDPYAVRGLPIMRGFVKLAEACDFFGIVNEDAHDALSDARAARALLALLIRDGTLPPPTITYAANRPAA